MAVQPLFKRYGDTADNKRAPLYKTMDVIPAADTVLRRAVQIKFENRYIIRRRYLMITLITFEHDQFSADCLDKGRVISTAEAVGLCITMRLPENGAMKNLRRLHRNKPAPFKRFQPLRTDFVRTFTKLYRILDGNGVNGSFGCFHNRHGIIIPLRTGQRP